MKTIMIALTLALHSTQARAEPDARDTVTYLFDDDLVKGDVQRPAGEVLHVTRARKHGSLIRIRTQFIDRLLDSVQAL